MILVLAAFTAGVLVVALIPRSTLRLPIGEQRRAAVLTVLLTAWPASWTFLFGPAIFGDLVPSFYPVIWYGPAMTASFVILVRNINTPGARPDRVAFLVASVSVLALLSVVLAPKNSSDIIRWAMAALLISGTLVAAGRVPARAIAVGCRIALALIALAVVVAVLATPAVVSPCRADKCGIAGQVLTSPFAGNGNILGLYAAMLLPFALHRAGLVRAGLTVVGVIGICELAGSRSALIGVALVTVVYGAIRVCSTARARSVVLAAGVATALVGSLVPAVMVYGDEAFTFRGTLWNQAKSFIAEQPVFGAGPTAWEKFGLTSVEDANYSPHNIWLDMTVSIGVWGVSVIVLALVLLLRRSESEDRIAIGMYLCGLLAIGALESLFVPYFIGIAPFVAILPLLVGGMRDELPESVPSTGDPPEPSKQSHPTPPDGGSAVTTSEVTWTRSSPSYVVASQ
ncbi:O-antigen polymerase OS=Tsukamurella paurometabola (strain ATCC 8368 / DSM / CCUG 35730 / CIP 100753 / JCM 10117 / KCTC 9821 / NBRC 16120 / NCIMB 702349/ NCTC 13040) OX=521096 GN=Tpau_2604 PE=4 SV=1 [Tsukamurella paurometabola]|uniref:O-antigen polymerase n=1 Tax=Tsukamurella paurometabola (strain ATCC 8368 / DSM 20162 / CCUG 35730 / CIP 100753 / JCM 10117 / KCTC 9821 / NBRC 16120 / NCIMB 702349 / NCTC 13040) TaxID=521096 RepID=D5US02_TSUPD|nr:O-antigen ligase family protein [Tsukamurella paurometabola]ADG79207.1 O-antigen polymerase [Tsukamurella paurometabola DSM 20162]SUP34547.1 Lipid A core - O-antigen ligase and related enzymes [Tsukamurella paurometabola]